MKYVYPFLWLPTFILIGLISLFFILLGYIMIPIAVFFKAYEKRKSSLYPDRELLLFTWKVMEVFQNYEDGILAGEEYKDKPDWFRIIYWSAVRNPANLLRYVPLLAPIPNPMKVKYIASFGNNHPLARLLELEEKGAFWYLAWQGPYANFRIQFWVGKRLWRVWIGTKLYPSSQFVVQEYQKFGCGTTFQIKDVTRFE